MVFVGLEISDGQGFDNGLEGGSVSLAFARQKNKLLHAAGFQIAQSGAGNLSQIAGGKLATFSGAHQQQAFRVHPFRKMQHDGRERLAGDFSAGRQRGDSAVHRGINVHEHAFDFLVVVKYIGYERVGMDGRVGLVLKLDLHGSLFYGG